MNKRLKLIRNVLDLNQEDFGSKIFLTKGAISNIENGTRELTEKNIKLICQEFNVNEEWLRTGAGEMFNTESDLISLVAKNLGNMDDFDMKIIIEYLKLSTEQRKPIKDFIKRLI